MLTEIGIRAKQAAYELSFEDIVHVNKALRDVAVELLRHKEEILSANALDMENARQKGMSDALLDRLLLTEDRLKYMSDGLRQIADLESPVGKILDTHVREDGLTIIKKAVPMGVIGVIYEARPNVTTDVFGLCFKTQNAVILRGGTDSINSNKALVDVIRETLKWNGMNLDFCQLIEDTSRETATEFMKLDRYVDLLIPRGGAGLIRSVVENSTIPVIETGTGNCHIYLDETANEEMALNIIINAKTQRIGVCNACESLVVHSSLLNTLFPKVCDALKEKGVEIRGDERACSAVSGLVPATEDDFGREYLDLIISVKTVDTLDEAVDHINKYNTKHSDAIITQNQDNAGYFLEHVDAACVYVNASTRFTDGFEFGLGAEIGISTQKLHARGPMGLEAITSYKYQIIGNGQTRK